MVTAADQLGLQSLVLDLRSTADIDPAFERASAWGLDSALIRNLPPMNSDVEQMLAHVANRRLPAISSSRYWVAAGLLMMLQTNTSEKGRLVAPYIARILDGADPADMPFFRATRFDLVVNTTTLANLGLSMPADVEAQVTEWVA
jgi:putative ABC transport system substrate-binding protein